MRLGRKPPRPGRLLQAIVCYQELAAMSYGAGKVIRPRSRRRARREVFYTQETLFIRRGKLRVDFCTSKQDFTLRNKLLDAAVF